MHGNKTRLLSGCFLGLGLLPILVGCGGNQGNNSARGPAVSTSKNEGEVLVPTAPQREGAADPEEMKLLHRDPPKAVVEKTAPNQIRRDEKMENDAKAVVKAPKAAQDEGKVSAKDAGKDVKVQTASYTDFEKFVANHKGKRVAVDCWATWCIPCVQKYPKFVSLTKEKPWNDVVFATLSFDDQEEAEKVKTFLGKHDANAQHFLITDELQEVLTKVGAKVEGVPLYVVFDKEGKIAVASNEFDDLKNALSK